jgi:hypothetical protein
MNFLDELQRTATSTELTRLESDNINNSTKMVICGSMCKYLQSFGFNLVNVGCLFKSEYESPWETTALLISRGWGRKCPYFEFNPFDGVCLGVFPAPTGLCLRDKPPDRSIYISHTIYSSFSVLKGLGEDYLSQEK